MNGKYADMLELPHHVSSTRPHLSRLQRAAQFAPFAALTGYDAAVREAGRLTERRKQLDEGEKAALNEALCLAAETGALTEFIWFREDERKEGGAYVSATGCIRRIDPVSGTVFLTDGSSVPIADLFSVVPAT